MSAGASVVIERAGVAHAEVLACLHETSFERPWPVEEFARLLAMPGTLGFIASREGGVPAAMIVCRHMSGEAEVLTLVVHPAMRREAIGTALVTAATDQLRTVTDSLFLEVAESNTAGCALYTALGFVEVGRRPGYYLISGTREDALVMRADLC